MDFEENKPSVLTAMPKGTTKKLGSSMMIRDALQLVFKTFLTVRYQLPFYLVNRQS